MKRILLNSTLVLVTLTAKSFAGYVAIPSDKLEQYKTAVSIAASQSSLKNCNEIGKLSVRTIAASITEADSGQFSLDGKQPVLIFQRS